LETKNLSIIPIGRQDTTKQIKTVLIAKEVFN